MLLLDINQTYLQYHDELTKMLIRYLEGIVKRQKMLECHTDLLEYATNQSENMVIPLIAFALIVKDLEITGCFV